MTDSKEIIKKIAALRVRLDKAQGLLHEAGTAAQDLMSPAAEAQFEGRLHEGAWHSALIDGALRTLTDPGEAPPLPEKLIARGARLLKHTRELLGALRTTADDAALPLDPEAPLAVWHREATALVDNVLRTVQAFPPSPGAQLRLCQGLELVLGAAQQRLAALRIGLERRRVELARVNQLAQSFAWLRHDQAVTKEGFYEIADQMLAEAQSRTPLAYWEESPAEPARFAAAHGYNVAQVLARVLSEEQLPHNRRIEAVVAGLMHDLGITGLRSELLTQPEPFNDEQRRAIEQHCHDGGRWAAKIWPEKSLPVQAATDHHERADGMGYPAGKRVAQLDPLVRLLSACDVYVAMSSPRPHRPAHDPRTALTDTLLEADRGPLDKQEAEKLLRLGFYPVGCLVELDDGALGLVAERNPAQPAKPVVALLTGPKRQRTLSPRLVDLAKETGRSILKQAPAADRLKVEVGMWHRVA